MERNWRRTRRRLRKEIVMSRRSLLSTTTGVLLLVAPTMAAWAGSHNATLPHPSATIGNFGFGGSSATNNAYNVSTALSTALSVGGTADAASLNTNLIGQANAGLGSKKGPVIQFNSAPTVQTAVGTAVSIGGNASAAAINTNDISQIGLH
jgi:hypothetical protein